ncbi:MAG: NADH-quinone oxidoreductase subunit NuoB [Candidatus Obscuribacterales bacterium]|nr:NADH-quinone oxidoreductase subunit NuoB [Candidatus Obscuribacterales bacterium]
MIRLLSYLVSKGVVTSSQLSPPLQEGVRGLPSLTNSDCIGIECAQCEQACPTSAIQIEQQAEHANVRIDLGNCIACGLCTSICPTATIVNNPSTRTAQSEREHLIIQTSLPPVNTGAVSGGGGIFRRSMAVRVVSTGCSACDLEIGASGNPIFDMERFGVSVVASPRFADALVVTGPVPKAMHEPLRTCYEAMADPRLVIALGTCAISGGVHKNGYTEANGANGIVPVDLYVPGCPPHPWSILFALQMAMQLKARRS